MGRYGEGGVELRKKPSDRHAVGRLCLVHIVYRLEQSFDNQKLFNVIQYPVSFMLKVQKDIELDQARLQIVTDQSTTSKTTLLQQSTSTLTEKYPLNQVVSCAKYPHLKPSQRLSPPNVKQRTSKQYAVEYNPTPIKELEKQKKISKYDEYDPATNFSVYRSNSPIKRKTLPRSETTDVRTEGIKSESIDQAEATFSEDDEDDIKAPDFSDLDDSEDETIIGDNIKNTISEDEDIVGNNIENTLKLSPKGEGDATSKKIDENINNKSENGADEFDIFDKAGRQCNKGINILPVEDILGIKLDEPTPKGKPVVVKESTENTEKLSGKLQEFERKRKDRSLK